MKSGELKIEDGCVRVPVGAGRYAVLTVDIGDKTLAVVLPHPPLEAEMAGTIKNELADIHKLVTKWCPGPEGENWSVHVVGEYIELFMPPPPGETEGYVMGLDEKETIRLIEGLAQSLAALRAERKAKR